MEVDMLAVLVAAIASFVAGALWYSPLMFGNMWVKLMGWSKKEADAMAKGAGANYVFGFIVSVVTAYILAHLMQVTDASSMQDAAELSFWLWLGFQATKNIGGTLWCGQKVQLTVLNSAYDLVNLVVMALVLSNWG